MPASTPAPTLPDTPLHSRAGRSDIDHDAPDPQPREVEDENADPVGEPPGSWSTTAELPESPEDGPG